MNIIINSNTPAFELFMQGVQAEGEKHYADRGYTFGSQIFTFEAGQKYIRIICNDVKPGATEVPEGASRRVHCFIDRTNGDVLKAASWKAPAKRARGNIFNPDHGMNALTPYGAAYLR